VRVADAAGVTRVSAHAGLTAPELPRLRTLLVIDVRSGTRLSDTVATVAASSSHVTVVALPRMPLLWQYAPLSGVSPDDLRRLAQNEAQDLLRRVVDRLPLECTVEHRVLWGWRDVAALLHERAYHVAVLAASPGSSARRAIAAAGRRSGTELVTP
jgi:hypothetical protein